MSSRSKSKKEREAVFQPEFREDLSYWVETDRRTALRIIKLVEAVMRDPFQGIGKPEPLKYDLAGLWSRRIDREHRLVYQVEGSDLLIYSCRYHYDLK